MKTVTEMKIRCLFLVPERYILTVPTVVEPFICLGALD